MADTDTDTDYSFFDFDTIGHFVMIAFIGGIFGMAGYFSYLMG
jgi:hypothetical protein